MVNVLIVLGRVDVHVDGPEDQCDEGRTDVDVAHDGHPGAHEATLDHVAQDLKVLEVPPLYHSQESSVKSGHHSVVDDDLDDEKEDHLTAVEIELDARILREVAHERSSRVLSLDFRGLPYLQLGVKFVVVLNV